MILYGHEQVIAADLPSRIKYQQWNSVRIPLHAAGKWYRLVGTAALEGKPTDQTPVSDDVIREVLSDLRDVWIRSEYLHGDDIGRLDNVLIEAPDHSVFKTQENTTTDSVLGSVKNGKRMLDATPK